MPAAGVEPAWANAHQILSLARLPVPPRRQARARRGLSAPNLSLRASRRQGEPHQIPRVLFPLLSLPSGPPPSPRAPSVSSLANCHRLQTPGQRISHKVLTKTAEYAIREPGLTITLGYCPGTRLAGPSGRGLHPAHLSRRPCRRGEWVRWNAAAPLKVFPIG